MYSRDEVKAKESRGCTYASSWRDYPFLRMANVHVEPGRPGSPTLDQINGRSRLRVRR